MAGREPTAEESGKVGREEGSAQGEGEEKKGKEKNRQMTFPLME